MKHLKKFENFHDDGLEVDSQTTPKYNQELRLKAKKYVEDIFNAGAGAMANALCKEINLPLPKTDEEIEAAMSKAIEYFTQNPERIKEITPPEHRTYPFYTGDGISRVNNVGGVHHDKYTS